MRAIRMGLVSVVALLISGCAGAPSPSSSAVPSTVLPTAPSAMPPSAPSSPSPTPTVLPPGPATIAWQRQAIPSIPASAVVGGLAFRPGDAPLYVAAGVWDFASASSSAGGNSHLGTVWTSTDGRIWDKVGVETARMLWDVAYGDGRFVAVGGYSGPPPSTSVTLAAMALGDEPGVWSSTDGRRWTAKQLASGGTVTRVIHGDAGFVAIGADTECSQGCGPEYAQRLTMHVSDDGLNWSSSQFPDGTIANVAALPGHGYTAIGSVGGACGGAIWHSDDGLDWRRLDVRGLGCEPIHWLAVTADGYAGLGATEDGEGSLTLTLRTSPDGLSWTEPILIAADAPQPRTFGLVGQTVVFSAGDSIWEILPGETRLRGPVDGQPFSTFAGGMGLDVSEQGAFAIWPAPAP